VHYFNTQSRLRVLLRVGGWPGLDGTRGLHVFMSNPLKLVSSVALMLAIACVFGMVQKRQTRTAEQVLASIIPQITSVVIYDIDGGFHDPNALASATSAPFPVEVFRQSCAAAIHEGGPTLWKGSSLAVLTLSDGNTRRARLSYHGGFISVDGTGGCFVVRGSSSSVFHRLFHRVIQEQFVPKRHE
jgi:hypothetical protein